MSTTPSVYEYRIFCETENTWVIGYATSPLTTCPNNTAHIVNPNSVQEIELVGPNTVVAQDSSPNTGYYQMTTIPISIPATASVPQVITISVVYPFDIYLWETSVAQNPSNLGDELDIQIAPNTIVGVLTQAANPGDTTIYVTSTVFGEVVRGCEIGVTDGTNTEFPGLVTAISPTADTLTFQTPLVNSYPAGSEILWSVYPVRHLYFDSVERLIIGSKGLKTRFIPAGTTINVIYTDNTINPNPLTVYIQIQYYRI